MIIFRNSPQDGNSLLIGSLEQWDQGSRALLWVALNKLYSPNPCELRLQAMACRHSADLLVQSLGTPDYSVFPSTFPANISSRWWNRHTVLLWSPSVNGSKQQAVRRTLIGDYVIQPN